MNTLTYNTGGNTHVHSSNGAKYSLSRLLIPETERPRGGWKAKFVINGFEQNFDYPNARGVFSLVRKAFDMNKVPALDRDIWLNLNIQWMKRLSPKQQPLVELEILLDLSGASPKQEIPASIGRRSYSPKEWGSRGWSMLQMYLAQDVYQYERFLDLAQELLKWIDPDVNPSMGCGECYQHFHRAVLDLRVKPLHSQSEARQWLFNVMNAVRIRNGKQAFAFETISKSNYWR